MSGYLDKVVRGEPQKNNILEFIGKAEAPETEIDFETFVRAVCEMPVLKQDPHWRVQNYQTCQEGINFDFIGKFEQLENDLRAVAERSGISEFITSETFGAAGKTSRQHATGAASLLRQYYNPALEALVWRAFREDFERFEYKKGLPGF